MLGFDAWGVCVRDGKPEVLQTVVQLGPGGEDVARSRATYPNYTKNEARESRKQEHDSRC